MNSKRLLRLSALSFCLFGLANPVLATEFCIVKKTADGFVALRAAPYANGKQLARMKAGDEVRLLENSSGSWRSVIYWPKQDRLTASEKARTIKGWVNHRLIDDCG